MYTRAMASTTYMKRYIAALQTLLAKQGDAANPFVLEDVQCVLLEP